MAARGAARRTGIARADIPDGAGAVEQMRRPVRIRWIREHELRPLERRKVLRGVVGALHGVTVRLVRRERPLDAVFAEGVAGDGESFATVVARRRVHMG